MENRVFDIKDAWEFEKKYTLQEMFFSPVGKWNGEDENKWFYDVSTLLTHIFQTAVALSEEEVRKLGTLKKNATEMRLNRENYPANFYEDSECYKYKKRSCSNCIYRPTCSLHIGKNWELKWCDNGRAGCGKYFGPFIGKEGKR